MLLVDDKLENIKSAVKTMGSHAIHVTGDDGLTFDHLDKIYSTCDDIDKLKD